MMQEESAQLPQQNNNIFFEQLVNSGFFPQSPELVLNLNTVNPGNEQKVQTPETTKSEQQSNNATQDLEKQATENASNQQKTNINAKSVDLAVNQIDNNQLTPTQQDQTRSLSAAENNIKNIQPTPIQQDQTRSLSAAENNIKDLDQKSKLNTLTPSASIPQEPLQEEEQPRVVMNNDSSTTNVKMIDPDYTKIIMEKYKSPPNWRTVIG